MSELWGFEPLAGPSAGSTTSNLFSSTTVAATGTSATAGILPGNVTGSSQRQVQIANTTSSWAYVNFGETGSLSAATVAAGYPVAPGGVVVVTVAPDVSGCSVILTSGGSGNVIFTRGVGL